MNHPKDDLTGLDALTGSNVSGSDPHAFNEANPDQFDDQIIAHALELDAWVEEKRKQSRAEVVLDISTPKASFSQLFSSLQPLTTQLKKVHRKITAQPSIEILQVAHFCQNDEKNFQWGWIIPPQKGDEIQGTELFVSGWLVGRNLQPIAIQFLLNDQLIAETPIQIPRPDVIKAHFYDAKFSNCGFSAVIDMSQTSRDGDLHLNAIFPNQQIIPVGFIRFRKFG